VSERGRDLLILALLGALLYLPGLGLRDVWNPDEARYAEVARETRLLGDWAVPHLNGEVYSQKPPLFFWTIAAAAGLTRGVDETSARLPSALSAIAALLLVYLMGERLFGRRAAWLAAAAFGTCFKILWQGRFGQIDMFLTALMALGVWLWVRGYTERRPGFYWGVFLAAALATLAKGPVGLLPPLLAFLLFLGITGDREEIRRMRIGRGLLLWAVVMLAWLVPAGLEAGPEYLRQIVFRQTVTRYANPWHHFAPPWFYLEILPGDFFPWSFLLPTAVVVGWKRLVGRLRPFRREGGLPRAGFLLALCWVVVTLVFFSLSAAKRSVYILTMYPALALLVGAGLDLAAAEWPRWRRAVAVPLGLMTGLTLLVAAALPVLGRRRPETAALGGISFAWGLVGVLLPLLLAAGAAWWSARSGAVRRAAATLAAGMALTSLALFLYALPRFDVFKSARGLSRTLVSRMAPGEPYGIYPRLDSTFLFYTRRFCVDIESDDDLRRLLARPGRVWLLAERGRDFDQLKGLPPLVEIARDADPGGYTLFLKP
jgi:4-amino-4-deoxy-L-arabinose transferase-like glycosyltransferase